MAQVKRVLLQSPLIKIGLGVLFLLLIGLVFLPQICSTSWMKSRVTNVINTKIPGTLYFSHLTLSWLKGLQIGEVKYEDPTQGLSFTADEISTSKGLLALATNYKDAGTIDIKRPLATITLPGSSETASTGEVKAEPGTQETVIAKENSPKPEAKQKESVGFLPPVHLQLNISDGSLITIGQEDLRKTVLKDLKLQLNVDGTKKTIDYQLSFQDDLSKGKVTGEGNVLLPQDASEALDALQSKADLKIENWQIEDLLAIAAKQASIPNGKGLVDGLFQISGSGTSTIGITGNLAAREISLQGGPLKSDTPSIEKILVDLNVQKTQNTIEIQKLQIQSPLVNGVVTGSLEKEKIHALKAQATVNAAEILSQFPATLNLKQGVSLSEGIIDLTTDVSSAGTDTVFQANANLKRLAGRAEDKNITWDKPVEITVQGKQGPDTLILDKLTVDSSFLQASGSGDTQNIQLKLSSDLGTALKEFEKFIDLDGWIPDGKLALDLNISGTDKEKRKLQAEMKVDNFKLSHNGALLSPPAPLTASIATHVQLDAKMKPTAISNSTIDFSSWQGSGKAAIESFRLKTAQSPAALKTGELKVSFDLSRITTLLHTLESLPQDQTLAGALDLSINANGEQIDKPDISLSADIHPFTFQKGDKTITEENVSLALEATADLATKSYTIKDLKLNSKAVTLQTNATLLAENKEQLLSAKGTTNLELASIGELLQSFAELKLTMSGVSNTPFTLQASTTAGKWADIPKHSQFAASFLAETINGYGLTIESLSLPIQLKDSLATIDMKAQVNKGELTLKPTIDFTAASPLITLAKDSTILSKVGLTEAMSNDLLAKVHPLFTGASVALGTINLDMQHLHVPVDKKLQKDIAFAGTITFNDVKLQADSMLTPLLAIMKVEENEIRLSDTPMTFVGADERITCSPLEAIVNEHSLILEGSIGFDQSLDYSAKIPITRKMVGGDIYKYLEGTFITVPITGTVSKPSISDKFIQRALADLIKDAGKQQLGDQAGKLLKKLFN